MDILRNVVGWFELHVQDMARAKGFYEATFQLRLEKISVHDLDLWAFPSSPDQPGCGGALIKLDGKDSGSGGTIVYFSCQDCAVVYARALEAGGQSHMEKRSIGEYGYIAMVLDTEGNMIGLHSLE